MCVILPSWFVVERTHKSVTLHGSGACNTLRSSTGDLSPLPQVVVVVVVRVAAQFGTCRRWAHCDKWATVSLLSCASLSLRSVAQRSGIGCGYPSTKRLRVDEQNAREQASARAIHVKVTRRVGIRWKRLERWPRGVSSVGTCR